MSSMGFGQNACKWVSIMLRNTSATTTFNGWRSASFPERSGVQQGSPLSPLLYVIAAQPLASHLRRQSQLGVIRPITMPDGQPAPVSHQHADDTSLHVLQPRDAQTAIDTSIGLFCAASCSQLNANKSQAFLVQSQPLASASVSALPSISFITGQQTVKHLGRHLSRLFATAGLSWWLSRDVVESQLLGRGVCRGNSTQNHALSGCARLIRLVSRCLLSATTRDAFAASQGPIWRCDAAEDGV